MNSSTKNVWGAIVVFAAMVLGLAALLVTTSGRPAAPAAPASGLTEARPSQPPSVPRRPSMPELRRQPRPLGPGFARPRNDTERRQLYARGHEMRFARRGQQIHVQAEGPDATSYQISWPPQAPDHSHIEQLKHAEPFHNELRMKGFRSLVLKIGPRVVWSTELK